MQITVILGSNSGDKFQLIRDALTLLEERAGRIKMISSLYETAPWGFESKEMFINQVAVFETPLLPHAFLQICQETEHALGRIRTAHVRYASRTIDIDILFCESLIIRSPELTVPHPRLQERNFVLVPLEEIMPDFEHPVLHKKISVLLSESPDSLAVKKQSNR